MKLATKHVIILCDDIRREVGNKFSLMGIYNYDVILPSMPHTFPKLCFFVMLNGINRKIMPANLDIKIFTPQSEPMEMVMTFAAPAGGAEFSNANMGIELAQFPVQCPGEMRIEINIRGHEKPAIVEKFFFKTK
jgi:hypothetical protein